MIPFKNFIEELKRRTFSYDIHEPKMVGEFSINTEDMASFIFEKRSFIVSYGDSPRYIYIQEVNSLCNLVAIPIYYDGEEGLKQIVKEFFRYKNRL